jgi:hypothetical protein
MPTLQGLQIWTGSPWGCTVPRPGSFMGHDHVITVRCTVLTPHVDTVRACHACPCPPTHATQWISPAPWYLVFSPAPTFLRLTIATPFHFPITGVLAPQRHMSSAQTCRFGHVRDCARRRRRGPRLADLMAALHAAALRHAAERPTCCARLRYARSDAS